MQSLHGGKTRSGLCLAGLLIIAGCEELQKAASKPDQKSPAPKTAPVQPSVAPTSVPNAPLSTTASASSAPTPATGNAVSGSGIDFSKPSADQLPVKLSTGVALPQTGAEGTLMSFSIDYQFVEGRPSSAGNYVCVVKRAVGEPAVQPVQLEWEGNIIIFLNGWRPNEGPFSAHLEEIGSNSRREVISDEEELK